MSSDLRRLEALDPNAPEAPGRAVPDGPRANRRAVRRFGALAALVAPVAAAVAAGLLLWGSTTGWRGVPGFALLIAAAPLLPLTGVPAEGGLTRYAVAIAASAVMWLVIGTVAARRAARSPVATWEDWRREYLPLAAGASGGGLLAVGAWLAALQFGWI